MTPVYEGGGFDDRDITTVTYRHDDDSVVVIVVFVGVVSSELWLDSTPILMGRICFFTRLLESADANSL